jgi:arylsulfatase A-like enzyme
VNARRARNAPGALLALALLVCAGCPKKPDPTKGGAPTATSAPLPPPETQPTVAMDLLAGFDDCVLGHYGPLVDLGDRTARASLGPRLRGAMPEAVERDGATWARVTSRTFGLSFLLEALPDAGADAVVIARLRGGSARSVTVLVNDKPAGTMPLAKGEVKIDTVRVDAGALAVGMNQLSFHFNGVGRGSTDEVAEIDWVHVGAAPPEGAYAAPTRQSAIVSATVGTVPKRALSLRAPGYARCTGVLPSGGTVETSVALGGATDGELEVRLLRDRMPPTTLGTVRLGPGDANAWKTLRLPLGDLGGKGALAAIALVAKSVTKGGRILFAEPRVLGDAPPPPPSPAGPAGRGVVLVVLGAVSPRGLALYGGPRVLPELAALAAGGVTFEAQRATTTVPSGATASMLTGLEALAHGVSDYDRKLAANVTTVADAAREGGVVAAMLTGNPLTGAAFGFDRSWETFEMRPPEGDASAMAVFDRGVAWLEAHKSERFLLVIHARGGHPPWDATADELKALAPPGYTGNIDPKHAAELLAKARRVPPVLRFGDQDRARTWALYDTALQAHDAALGRIMTQLKTSGRDADTTVIVTSDVSVDEAAHVPFGDGETLDEGPLRVPLVVRPFAEARGGAGVGRRVGAATSGLDLARTMLGALGLAPPSAFGGMDLSQALPRGADDARPLLATLGERYSLLWGSFILTGMPGKDPKLCNLSLEPVCTTDVRPTHPLATEATTREVWDALEKLPASPPREIPSIDAATAAALKAWGR